MKKIGIIGGAGPMSGILLHRMIIEICQKTYNAQKDEDYPMIIYLSYPFKDMLTKLNAFKKLEIQNELEKVFLLLKKYKLDAFAIACNTLHYFIKKRPKNFLDLIEETKEVLKGYKTLVLCTSTSRKSKIHKKICDAIYPEWKNQKELDSIIDIILSGKHTKKQSDALLNIIKKEFDKKTYDKILLGCTEFSLLYKEYTFKDKIDSFIEDPLEIMAKKLCKISME